MNKTGIVFERPKWARRARAMELTGVTELALLRLVNDGFVRARKMDVTMRSGTVFNVPDIEQWLDEEAPHAGPYKLPGTRVQGEIRQLGGGGSGK